MTIHIKYVAIYYWDEPERAPHRRVERLQSIYMFVCLLGTSVTCTLLYTLDTVRDIFHHYPRGHMEETFACHDYLPSQQN